MKFGGASPHTLFPSPLRGEGARAKRGRVRGQVTLMNSFAPSPGTRSLSLRVCHPLPPGERGSEIAAALCTAMRVEGFQ